MLKIQSLRSALRELRALSARLRPTNRYSKEWVASAVICLLSLVILWGLPTLTLQLYKTALLDAFVTQNAQHIKSADTFLLSQNLNQLSSNQTIACTTATLNENLFFESNKQKKCSAGLLQKQIVIRDASGIDFIFILQVPQKFYFPISALLTSLAFMLYLTWSLGRARENAKLQSEQKLAAISHQLAHDIRSPVAALELVTKTLKASPAQEELLKKSVLRIKEIANSVLQMTKNETSKPQTFDLLSVTKSNLTLKTTEFENLNIEFNAENTFDQLQVTGNSSDFARILSNLINNSVESTPMLKRPMIKILTLKNQTHAVFKICDNGAGIPQDVLKQLGKKKLISKKSHGSGIGIYSAVQKLLEWGGNLKVTKSDKNGTEICLYLKLVN